MQETEKLRNKVESACLSNEMKPRGIYEWIDYYQKNKPQTNALAAGVMIVLYGGQHLGWGIFNNHLQAQPWAGGYEDEGTVFWAIISWFIAAIAGFAVASVAVNKISKMAIYIFGAIFASVSAILLIVEPESIYYIFPARILGGFSYGIAYITVLIHACEVAVPRLRGMVVSTVHLCLIVGIFSTSSSLFPVYDTRQYQVDPTKTLGMNGLICILTGLLIAIFFNRESPVFLIKKYREEDAIKIMIRLRSESHETADIRRDFNELKLMAMEDGRSNLNIFDKQNRWPLFVVFVMKVIFVASFNLPLNLVWLEAAEIELYNGTNDASGMFLSGTRFIVILVMMFFIDVKHIKFYMISAVVSSLVLFTAIYSIDSSGGTMDQRNVLVILAFIFQASSGAGIGILSDVYATEAFNTKKKPFSIAFVSAIEFGLQILFVAVFFYVQYSLLSILAVFAVTLAIGVLAFFIPDTSGMSLRNARNKFQL